MLVIADIILLLALVIIAVASTVTAIVVLRAFRNEINDETKKPDDKVE